MLRPHLRAVEHNDLLEPAGRPPEQRGNVSPARIEHGRGWDALRGTTISSHAALVDIRTARVHDLGPAVAAFWIR